MAVIGIYSGTFDPPHMGHIQSANYAVEALGLSHLLVIPTGIGPNKKDAPAIAKAEARLRMLQLAFSGRDDITVSDLEASEDGISYTYSTVSRMRTLYPKDELVLCMGTDMFLKFSDWRDADRILREASLAVFRRGRKKEDAALTAQKAALEAMGGKVYLIDNPVILISSSDLRRLLKMGCSSEFLPEAVEHYIREEGLYGTEESLLDLSMEDLERNVVSLLKPDRVNHVLGCRDTAVALARHWGADEVAAARAGLLHDITKALDGALQLTLCRQYGIILDNFSGQNPKTLHAITGSKIAEKIFGEKAEVVSAIRSHTTGKANMNLLEKIIYIADYMEPNRDFPGVEKLRELAFTDIDRALKMGLEMTLATLTQQGREISPESQEALAYLNQKWK